MLLALPVAAAWSVGLALAARGRQPGGVRLAAFAWLLTLHPMAAGRTYGAYGGVYVAVALLWLWLMDGVSPNKWDLIGTGVTLAGMAIIAFAPRG